MGLSPDGINREVSSILEWANICKYERANPLAIPEVAVYKMATLIPLDETERVDGDDKLEKGTVKPSWTSMARGLLPSLRYLVNRDISNGRNDATNNRSRGTKGKPKTTDGNVIVPDCRADNRGEYVVDAYDKTSYYCETCDCELSNLYFSCDGCVRLLNREFNLCFDCYHQEEYRRDVAMGPYNTDDESIPLRTDRHHIADNVRRQIVRSEQKKEKRSGNVNLCYECNQKVDTECLCHEEFSKRLRFYTAEMLEDMIARCEEKTGGGFRCYSQLKLRKD